MRLPIARQMVMDGRRRGPADTATLRPVSPHVRTRPGPPANFRLCASNRSWDGWLFTYGIISTRRLLNSLPGRHGGAGTAKIVTVAGAGGVLQKRVAVPDMTATYCLPAT